ncbi:hypothetical protein [Photobacterium sp. GSS17]|uniref:hypothetical protein n=1 Tax=Photobacterium TaxID=657 RepID=UPI002361145C|nr:hypothetical protein [Photobacterium sp. GSS17]
MATISRFWNDGFRGLAFYPARGFLLWECVMKKIASEGQQAWCYYQPAENTALKR